MRAPISCFPKDGRFSSGSGHEIEKKPKITTKIITKFKLSEQDNDNDEEKRCNC